MGVVENWHWGPSIVWFEVLAAVAFNITAQQLLSSRHRLNWIICCILLLYHKFTINRLSWPLGQHQCRQYWFGLFWLDYNYHSISFRENTTAFTNKLFLPSAVVFPV